MSVQALSATDDIWKCFASLKESSVSDDSNYAASLIIDPPPLHDDEEDSYVLNSTSYYKHMNCGPDALGGTRINNQFSKKTSRLVKTHIQCEQSYDTKRVALKTQLMNDDLNRLEQILRTRGPNLGDIHITECKRVYRLLAQCMEKLRMKRNKSKVEIAATYYALKQFWNPTPSEMEAIFGASHPLFLTSIKQARHIAHNCTSELGWIFDVERGQSNIFRYGYKMGLNYQTIRKLQKVAEEKNLNLQDEGAVLNLLKKVKQE